MINAIQNNYKKTIPEDFDIDWNKKKNKNTKDF